LLIRQLERSTHLKTRVRNIDPAGVCQSRIP
jgi:hypothetical protein